MAIDSNVFKAKGTRVEAKEQLGLSNRSVILFVGRKCPEKGPAVLVKALHNVVKYYPNVIAVFLGPDNFFGSDSSTYTEHLHAIARKCNVDKNVFFKGYVTDVELQTYYNAADVFVCPSIWNEPLGMVLIEALGYSKPVVASKVGGIPELIIDKKTGLLIEPGDFNELSKKIILLLDNPALGQELSANGRRLVEERFSLKVVSNLCLKIYKKVLE